LAIITGPLDGDDLEATCTGTVNGEPVTGTGRFLNNSHLLSRCTQATGFSDFLLKIPTATEMLTGHIT
jgi:hypothetical protein